MLSANKNVGIKKIMVEQKYPKFCILPWIHLFVSTTGTMRPCCVSKEFDHQYRIQNDGIEKFWNSTHMRELRSSLLAGEEPSICNVCWDKEAKGDSFSKRLGELSYHKDINIEELIELTGLDGSLPDNIVSYDLRLGNLCNLKCVMCNPHNSSKWLEDKEMLGKYENTDFSHHSLKNLKWPKDQVLWKYLENNYHHIKIMHFAGGEPLLHKSHHSLLQSLVYKGASKNIFLKYNTNITNLPDDVFDLWSKFKRVDLWCSIDGVGELNDYIRYPSKWNDMLESLSILDNTPENVNVKINTAVSLLNVEFIPEFYNFIVNQNYKKIGKASWHTGTHVAPDLVYDPIFLNIRILPESKKIKITEKILTHLETVDNDQYKNQMKYVLKYMNSQNLYEKHYSELLNYIKDLELARGVKYPYEIYYKN